MNNKLTLISHDVDICVIGGGIGGMFSAISAARHGSKVLLMHDRPVLGGNASSEIRMWISGAGTRVRDLQETGLLEELLLENMYRNPKRNFTVWDTILYEKVRFEPNIELLLNCTCCDAEMNDQKIESVTGFQLTTYQWHKVRAKIFIDCSGDSILAPLTAAEFRVGRESKEEFGESFGVEKADSHTMGMSLLIQARETDHPVSYIPPAWAYTYKTDEEMNFKPHDLYKINTNFYWIELGGMEDSIGDTEKVRDELLKVAFGVWDHMKNHGDHGAENWELEWVGFLPGKRESRRYVGDYMLTQNDVEQHPVFPDTVAYGGWQIDDHLPGGFRLGGFEGSHLHKRRLTEPYGIPYRCLYSKNIDNLMFAGRNISATHLGLSTSRVMGTVGVLGQAAGTAAAIAVQNDLSPREAGKQRIREIQAQLLEDDCFLPGFRRQIGEVSKNAKLTCDYGDCIALHNGLDRRIWGNDNGYFGKTNQAITYTFDKPTHLSQFRMVVDSDLNREYVEGNPDGLHTSHVLFYPRSYNDTSFGFPQCLLKSFRIEALNEEGEWQTVYETHENHQRLIRESINVTTTSIRLIPLSTYQSEKMCNDYGSSTAHIFAFDVK